MTNGNIEDPVATQPNGTVTAVPPGTPLSWRLVIAGAIIAIAVAAYLLQSIVGLRGQAFAGVLFYLGLVAMFSSNLRLVNWRTIGWGIILQLILLCRTESAFRLSGN